MKILLLTTTVFFVLLLSSLTIGRPSSAFNSVTGKHDTSPAQLFSQNCVKCHGADGRSKGLKGRTLGARDLTNSDWQERVSDERIFNSINNGKGKMPAYGKKLSESEVNSLVAYVRGLKK